jgi:hypothetical protein
MRRKADRVAVAALLVLIVAECASTGEPVKQSADVPEALTVEIARILPAETPEPVRREYVSLIHARINKGLSGAESFEFLRTVIKPANARPLIAGGNHPWNFLSMLVLQSGEIPDVEKKLGAVRDEEIKLTGRPNPDQFIIKHAAQILGRYDNWPMLRRFVNCRATTSTKCTLKEYMANPAAYERTREQ